MIIVDSIERGWSKCMGIVSTRTKEGGKGSSLVPKEELIGSTKYSCANPTGARDYPTGTIGKYELGSKVCFPTNPKEELWV